jgi:hypothetical protein
MVAQILNEVDKVRADNFQCKKSGFEDDFLLKTVPSNNFVLRFECEEIDENFKVVAQKTTPHFALCAQIVDQIISGFPFSGLNCILKNKTYYIYKE